MKNRNIIHSDEWATPIEFYNEGNLCACHRGDCFCPAVLTYSSIRLTILSPVSTTTMLTVYYGVMSSGVCPYIATDLMTGVNEGTIFFNTMTMNKSANKCASIKFYVQRRLKLCGLQEPPLHAKFDYLTEPT